MMLRPEPQRSPHRHTAAGEGESAPFHFESTWLVPADIDCVWEVISDLSSWSSWWPGVRRSSLGGDGRRGGLVVQSPLGYQLCLDLLLVEKHSPRSARFAASGDLRGAGSFRAETVAEGTRMHITWCVVTRHRWLAWIRPLAVGAHAVVMAAGQWGLRRACRTGGIAR
ncbi:Polyketide cyclase / dehydrase and lipid transport [Corynebacterium occultum]|uniref:Polyketide cyclase / dehydrase and lipid transport n=1 Tax=Corynebacterium occultum TaxID=2675219 RepID=A0A6B8VN55_9CORY|nr:SRPBCC family protein [Corynebacterium occultum]QGU06942.1 Polyketide cyclase / dehydrase and lipid transport [Corynebacterium occultum]